MNSLAQTRNVGNRLGNVDLQNKLEYLGVRQIDNRSLKKLLENESFRQCANAAYNDKRTNEQFMELQKIVNNPIEDEDLNKHLNGDSYIKFQYESLGMLLGAHYFLENILGQEKIHFLPHFKEGAIKLPVIKDSNGKKYDEDKQDCILNVFEHQREQKLGREFVNIFKEDHRRSDFEKELDIVLCEDGEISWFLFEFLIRSAWDNYIKSDDYRKTSKIANSNDDVITSLVNRWLDEKYPMSLQIFEYDDNCFNGDKKPKRIEKVEKEFSVLIEELKLKIDQSDEAYMVFDRMLYWLKKNLKAYLSIPGHSNHEKYSFKIEHQTLSPIWIERFGGRYEDILSGIDGWRMQNDEKFKDICRLLVECILSYPESADVFKKRARFNLPAHHYFRKKQETGKCKAIIQFEISVPSLQERKANSAYFIGTFLCRYPNDIPFNIDELGGDVKNLRNYSQICNILNIMSLIGQEGLNRLNVSTINEYIATDFNRSVLHSLANLVWTPAHIIPLLKYKIGPGEIYRLVDKIQNYITLFTSRYGFLRKVRDEEEKIRNELAVSFDSTYKYRNSVRYQITRALATAIRKMCASNEQQDIMAEETLELEDNWIPLENQWDNFSRTSNTGEEIDAKFIELLNKEKCGKLTFDIHIGDNWGWNSQRHFRQSLLVFLEEAFTNCIRYSTEQIEPSIKVSVKEENNSLLVLIANKGSVPEKIRMGSGLRAMRKMLDINGYFELFNGQLIHQEGEYCIFKLKIKRRK